MTKRALTVAGLTSAFEPYPVAVEADGLLYISGVRGGRPGSSPTTYAEIPAEAGIAGQGFSLVDDLEGRASADAWATHENLDMIMLAAGSDGSQVLRQHVWQADKRFFPQYERVRMAWQTVPSPSSGLGVAGMAGRFGDRYGIDAIGVVPGRNALFPGRSTVQPFDNNELPSASFYSQMVRCGPLVFVAGHIPIQTDLPGKPLVRGYDDVPEEGRSMMTGRSHPDSRHGPIAAQAWYTYDRIRANLAAQGLPMESIIQVTVFLQDLRDFAVFHRIHREFFPEGGPALTVTGFDEVGHRGTLIEIEPTVLDPQSGIVAKRTPFGEAAPFAGDAMVQVGPVAFLAGMLGLDAAGLPMGGWRDVGSETGRRVVRDLERSERLSGLAAQCWGAWEALSATLVRGGLAVADIVKTTVYLKDERDLETYEVVRSYFIASNLPAFDCVVVHGPGPVPSAHVQIEAIASA
ncbi:Rid family hydrolase [Aureimonas altamirensis]|uniref:Rid family hydrolase n=1 Tax=Aureimonas altamirensis TaxID=370622 RepID=UPI00301B51A3